MHRHKLTNMDGCYIENCIVCDIVENNKMEQGGAKQEECWTGEVG